MHQNYEGEEGAGLIVPQNYGGEEGAGLIVPQDYGGGGGAPRTPPPYATVLASTR